MAGSKKTSSESIEAITQETTGKEPTTTTTTTVLDSKEKGSVEVPEQTKILENNSAPVSNVERPKEIANDPILQYTAATSLYQEVQILNRYIEDVATYKNKTAFLVRLQLQVLPYARNVPYDIYSVLGFFAQNEPNESKSIISLLSAVDDESFEKSVPDRVIVLPIFVTDNLENSNSNRVAESIRALSVALSAVRTGVGTGFGLGRRAQEIDSILANDKNSIFTVGQITDNTISARFGAATQASSAYSAIPRTHYVTLLLFADDEWLQKDGRLETRKQV